MQAQPNTRISSFLSPLVCRAIFAVLMVVNFLSSWHFLTHNCPIDLSGDEAQYWDWSRHLDLSYYSKGPMVAYIIHASCGLLGNTMPGVRFPALLLAIGTSICTYGLTLKLFGSERLALGAVLLGGIVPMYAAGGMLMTIDPPLFFFWALATYLAAIAIFDNRRWAWPLAGVVAGLGVLTKYVMLLWPPFMLLFLAIDPASRSKLKTIWPWVMSLLAVLFLAPIVIWNAQHDWVSLHHVASQTGADSTGALGRGNLLAFVGAQVAAINPPLAVLLIAAVVYTLRARPDPKLRQTRYLLCIGGCLFLLCLLDSLRAKVQVNWPAPAYFTLLILTAYFISTHWRMAKGWFIGAVIFGIAIQPILQDLTRLYPVISWVNRTYPRKSGLPRLRVKNLDMEYKLRGMAEPFASTVADQLSKLPAGAFVLCEAYEDASELAFYLPGHPRTYFAGSYWTDLAVRRRWTQFDLWPDRALNRPELIGKDAIYVGFPGYAPLKQSFASIEKLPDITVRIRGMDVQTINIWKCTAFKGMQRPAGEGPR
jgi:undecaprenyl-diphosphatase